MKKNAFLLILLLAGYSCTGGKKNKLSKGPLASDRTVTVTLNPFWGGMPTCELERKNGKDKLLASYIVKNGQNDSLVYSAKEIDKTSADSIFAAADKVNFYPDNIYGNGDDKTGMKAIVSLKKKKIPQSVTFLRMKNVADLPADVQKLVLLMNRIAPDGFKLY